jgi:hypothetical protein
LKHDTVEQVVLCDIDEVRSVHLISLRSPVSSLRKFGLDNVTAIQRGIK